MYNLQTIFVLGNWILNICKDIMWCIECEYFPLIQQMQVQDFIFKYTCSHNAHLNAELCSSEIKEIREFEDKCRTLTFIWRYCTN